MTLTGEHFSSAELETVVSLLAGPGMIQRLHFGGFILLRPEALSRYAAAAVRKVRKHPQELGCIREDELLPVMLVVRTSDGVIRWMDVSSYLKRKSAGGKPVRQIVFDGERFDALSVQQWRERVLAHQATA
jgi:hypothetical protein